MDGSKGIFELSMWEYENTHNYHNIDNIKTFEICDWCSQGTSEGAYGDLRRHYLVMHWEGVAVRLAFYYSNEQGTWASMITREKMVVMREQFAPVSLRAKSGIERMGKRLLIDLLLFFSWAKGRVKFEGILITRIPYKSPG